MVKAAEKSKRVVVGLSGGLDSSVALFLLKKQGFSPLGLTLKLPLWQDPQNRFRENLCCTTQGLRWAKKLCLKLNVPYYVLDVQKEFQEIVVDYFVKAYQKGETPNPCMICNKYFRFPKFFEFAEKVKADFVATGHYAKKSVISRQLSVVNYKLLRAKDKNKDQSYFLSLLSQKELSRLLFPLGDYTKKEVRQIAQKQGFAFCVQRPESQDFCYLPYQAQESFLTEALGQKPGKILDQKGHVLGQHQGLHFYTLGQRKGLGLSGGPFWVFKLDVANNALIVSQNKKDLYQKQVFMTDWHFISGQPLKKPIKVLAKTRYRQPLSSATLFPLRKKILKLIFDQPQFAITPGQYAVFYLPAEASAKAGEGDVCLGAGKIIRYN